MSARYESLDPDQMATMHGSIAEAFSETKKKWFYFDFFGLILIYVFLSIFCNASNSDANTTGINDVLAGPSSTQN